MKIRTIIASVILLSIMACNRTEEVIASKYPNGTTLLVEHYQEVDGKKTLVKETRYYPNGQKEIEYELKYNKRNGLFKQWYATGEEWIEENYLNDIKHGEFTIFYPNGNINYTGFYNNGKPSGKWIFFDESGSMVSEKEY